MQMENHSVTELLRAAVINYPVLQAWGITLGKPLAFVFESKRAAVSYIRALSPDPQFIDQTTKTSTAKKLFETANSDGIFLIMPEGYTNGAVKMEEKIAMVYSCMQIGRIDDLSVSVLAAFVFIKAVPDRFQDNVSEIHISFTDRINIEGILELVPEPSQLALVKDKIREIGDASDEEYFLRSAAAFLYPKLADKGSLDEYGKLDAVIAELISAMEVYRDGHGIAVDLLETMYDFLESRIGEMPAYQLPDIGEEAAGQLEEALFYNSQFIYISEKKFREIIQPFTRAIPISDLKGILAKEDILLGDAGGYSAKMNFHAGSKAVVRVRMMKFKLKSMVLDGNRSFSKIITYF